VLATDKSAPFQRNSPEFSLISQDLSGMLQKLKMQSADRLPESCQPAAGQMTALSWLLSSQLIACTTLYKQARSEFSRQAVGVNTDSGLKFSEAVKANKKFAGVRIHPVREIKLKDGI
jgi:hypothetical protein